MLNLLTQKARLKTGHTFRKLKVTAIYTPAWLTPPSAKTVVRRQRTLLHLLNLTLRKDPSPEWNSATSRPMSLMHVLQTILTGKTTGSSNGENLALAQRT